MKEPYGKGLASHPGPESCDTTREGGAEAWTGERAGELSSREITTAMVPTPLGEAEGNSHGRASAVGEPQHARTLPAQELGDPTALRERMTPRSATRRPVAARRRWPAVGSRTAPEYPRSGRTTRPDPLRTPRRPWRERSWPRGTRTSTTRPGRRAGITACPVRSNGCAKQRLRFDAMTRGKSPVR